MTPPVSGTSEAPTAGEEEGGTPTPSYDLEEQIVTQVGPGVAAVPVGEETTTVLDLTLEPGNQTGWETVSHPVGTSLWSGWYGLDLGYPEQCSHSSLMPSHDCGGQLSLRTLPSLTECGGQLSLRILP